MIRKSSPITLTDVSWSFLLLTGEWLEAAFSLSLSLSLCSYSTIRTHFMSHWSSHPLLSMTPPPSNRSTLLPVHSESISLWQSPLLHRILSHFLRSIRSKNQHFLFVRWVHPSVMMHNVPLKPTFIERHFVLIGRFFLQLPVLSPLFHESVFLIQVPSDQRGSVAQSVRMGCFWRAPAGCKPDASTSQSTQLLCTEKIHFYHHRSQQTGCRRILSEQLSE